MAHGCRLPANRCRRSRSRRDLPRRRAGDGKTGVARPPARRLALPGPRAKQDFSRSAPLADTEAERPQGQAQSAGWAAPPQGLRVTG
jgi:hypothetical protein